MDLDGREDGEEQERVGEGNSKQTIFYEKKLISI